MNAEEQKLLETEPWEVPSIISEIKPKKASALRAYAKNKKQDIWKTFVLLSPLLLAFSIMGIMGGGIYLVIEKDIARQECTNILSSPNDKNRELIKELCNRGDPYTMEYAQKVKQQRAEEKEKLISQQRLMIREALTQ